MAATKTAPSSVGFTLADGHRNKKIAPSRLAREIKVGLGLRLMAETSGDAAQGHISTLSKPAGSAFGRAQDGTEIDVCWFCEEPVPRGAAHDDFELVLYDGHGLTAAQVALIPEILDRHVP